MATSGSCTDPYSGRTSFNGYLYVRRDAISGTSAKWAWELRARNPNGNTQTYMLDNKTFTVVVAGQTFSGAHNLDFRGGQSYIVLGSGVTGYINQGGGTPTISFSFSHGPAGVFGTAAGSGSFVASALATVPPAPTPLATTPDQISATSMRYQFSGNGDGGSAIIRWEYRYSTSSTFASGNSAWISSSGTSLVTNLIPNTKYYFQSRGVNSIGNGATSAISSGTTLSMSAPGMAVIPQPSGMTAIVGLTPPPEVSSVSGYRVEYRPIGGATIGIDVASSPQTVGNLVPGTTYEWRSAAKSGTYTGPFTAWESHLQPQPSADFGGYFDGSFPDRTDVTYDWTGTVNNSTSESLAFTPKGWGVHGTGGAYVVMTRVTGGESGAYAARVEFRSDATESGAYFGTVDNSNATIVGGFPVADGGSYSGMIYVQTSRPQRLAAMMVSYSSEGAEMGKVIGESVIVYPGSWVPLRVNNVSAFGGMQFMGVSVIDVEGDGWSLWKAGDSVLLDSAIAPFTTYYFDGDTTDTAEYNYTWTGVANESSSSRLENSTPPVDPLLDPDCPPVPLPPRPPAISESCVEDTITTWRQFWAEISWTNVPEWIDSVPIVHVETSNAVRLVRIRYYQNPFRKPLEEIPEDSYCNEQIISFIPGETILTLDGVSTRVWANISGSPDTLAADHLLYRGTGDIPVWPVLGCGSGYFITVDVPSDTPQGAISVNYELVPRYT